MLFPRLIVSLQSNILQEMNLFNNKPQSIESQQEPQQSVNTNSENIQHSTTQTSDKTSEEVARQWWRERFGESIPEEVLSWMKKMARSEARRQYLADSLLTPQQLQRNEDAKRLAETKLRNIESALQRIHDQQEWLRRFNERKHEFSEHKSRLFNANKQLTALANEERDLYRFETFETVQGLFQRMQLLERLTRNNKQVQGVVMHEAEDKRQHVGEMQKQLQQKSDNKRETAKYMDVVRDNLEQANRILGQRVVLEIDEKALNNITDNLTQQHEIIVQEVAEHEAEIKNIQDNITKQSLRLQSMEPHRRMIHHGGEIQILLERLLELHTEIDETTHLQKEQTLHQQQENEMLSRVFAEFQQVEQDINSLNAELHLHRQQNIGLSSYSLQERAMRLRSRRESLISAQSLWNRIQSGYRHIEEKTQVVNQLRLELEKLKHEIDELENKVVPMRQLCHEKEYTLTLSKSQNVIELRGDLKEGVSCTVCGAKTHPYHSDTMLEQSKLISEQRTEFEMLQAELHSKEKMLQELILSKTATESRRDVEEESLSLLRRRQMEDVNEWAVFATLDPSFKDCSSSTNFDARTTLIRQLIENAGKDADAAQHELDIYNFHQNRINETAESLTNKEQQRAGLTTRLNEVNTGCQVLARQVEQTRQTQAKLETLFTQVYERINGMISISDWYETWKANPETLRLQLQNMMSEWEQVNYDFQLSNHEKKLHQSLVETKRITDKFIETLSLIVRDDYEKRNTMRKEGEKEYATLLSDREVKDYYEYYAQQTAKAEKEWKEQFDATQKESHDLAILDGRLQELTSYGEGIASEAVSERSQLDIWMRQFNANHPPVQYAELEQAFARDMDWNVIREKIRSLRIEVMLEQARVDNLRSSIVALQAEGMRPSDDNEAGVLESLLAQKEQLEKQRQEVLLQLAEHHIAQVRHEKCREWIKAEEEKLYAMTDNR